MWPSKKEQSYLNSHLMIVLIFVVCCRNKDHPKLYLWAQPWNHNKKTDQDVTNLETASNNSQDESKPLSGYFNFKILWLRGPNCVLISSSSQHSTT